MQRMMMVLKRDPQQEAALRTLIDQQQDTTSPNYHHWLTPDQFGLQFGAPPPPRQGHPHHHHLAHFEGFQVAAPSRGRTVIEFSGLRQPSGNKPSIPRSINTPSMANGTGPTPPTPPFPPHSRRR